MFNPVDYAISHARLTLATLGRAPEDAAVERNDPEREAVARIAVGPFGDEQIVADHHARQHRSGRDAERGQEQAAEQHREQEQQQDETDGFAKATFGGRWRHRGGVFRLVGHRAAFAWAAGAVKRARTPALPVALATQRPAS